jgi:hypothetical protein
MATLKSYGTDAAKRQHAAAIHMLASASGLPVDSVRQLYENESKTLTQQARIRDFLPVIVVRRVKGKIDGQKV